MTPRRQQGISVADAAARAGVSTSTIQRAVDLHLQAQAELIPRDTPGQLAGYRIPAGSLEERRIDPAALPAWIAWRASHRHQTTRRRNAL